MLAVDRNNTGLESTAVFEPPMEVAVVDAKACSETNRVDWTLCFYHDS